VSALFKIPNPIPNPIPNKKARIPHFPDGGPSMKNPQTVPPLQQTLSNRIKNGGPLSFADFMEAALYDPFHGYYASGRAHIGRSGDFYTAVSSGPLFGRLLACQLAEMWKLAGAPENWTLVEQGAASGALSLDILEHLKATAPDCYANASLRIVEPFSHFQRVQSQVLLKHLSKVSWYRSIKSLPKFSGVHFSNELLDAFPVNVLQFLEGRWMELRVDDSDGEFRWLAAPVHSQALKEKAKLLQHPIEGQVREVCLPLSSWISELAEKMTTGWVLLFDYGMCEEELGAPHRRTGTLAAYRSHQRQDQILAQPGLQDLTAHVNFTHLSEAAIANNWAVLGYTDQARFLTGLAPLYFRDKTEPMTKDEQSETLNFRTLTHPQLMGGQFKAFCLGRTATNSSLLSGLKWAKDPILSIGLQVSREAPQQPGQEDSF